ncbi:PF14300 domain protein [Leptospira weilii str. LNT 1234]|nr:PF14300 domain protein [Leptospira weilii str. LNT 1234]
MLENLESIDSKFYEYPDNLTELLFDFVSKNSKDFGEIEKTS